MMAALLLVLAGAASYGGFACLALAMPDYWEQAHGKASRQPPPRPLRLTGAVLLATALALCLWRDGPGFGCLLWGVLLTAGAVAVAFTLTWRPRLLGLLTGTRPR